MKKSKIWRSCAAAGLVSAMVFCRGTPVWGRPAAGFASTAGESREDAYPVRNHMMVRNRAENRRLLMELASGNQEAGRHEVYVTGEDYVPDTLVIAQMFPKVINISNTVVNEYRRNGHLYTECRIGFQWQWDTDSCTHDWQAERLEESSCLTCGKERIWCSRCETEREAVLPAMGHQDRDHDSLCDRCGSGFLEQKNGDRIQILYETSGSSMQLNFTCVDEEYKGGVLYLCDEPFEVQDICVENGMSFESREEKIRWWLRMEFENCISVRSACREVLLADAKGQIVKEGEWKEETFYPAVILEKPVIGETAEKAEWKIGDLQIRSLGEKNYLFRCVDEDYSDANSNYQKTALFLCDTVIRSDVDSTDSMKIILKFGNENNYKSSKVRFWLNKNSFESRFDLLNVYTGVNSAFLGKTGDMAFGQTEPAGLKPKEISFQLMEDGIFLLSLEEALEYRDELWRFAGSERENPESQLSPCSKGYWLRTPVFKTGEDGSFRYGDQVYVVDLERGCLRPAEVSDGSMGIRPAFCVPQA